ncbi:RluA family pseudouridine synthase [Candidatus Gracilibacteria bacterium]|nr:RluA family pseudouridine synthase [Candidatus Gracilibacteria bacterium]
MRLDNYVAEAKQITRSQAQNLLKKECVNVDGKTIKKNGFSLLGNEKIIIKDLPAKLHSAQATKMTINVIFEDDDLLVLNKRQGIQVYPGDEGDMTGTLLSGLRYYFAKNPEKVESDNDLKVEKIGFIHRLDKDTSGCLMIAKNAESLAFYQKQFEERNVDKFYLAAVFGQITQKGKIEAPIGRSKTDRKKFAVVQDGRDAMTLFEPIEYLEKENITLLKVQILTGRTHQIRVHLKSIGHSIIGDGTYGNEKINEKMRKKFGINYQMLHCLEMRIDGKNGERQKFFAKPNKSFKIFEEDFVVS